jgi:F-box-like
MAKPSRNDVLAKRLSHPTTWFKRRSKRPAINERNDELLKQPKIRPKDRNQSSSILRLPNELLVYILNCVVRTPDEPFETAGKKALGPPHECHIAIRQLLFVCRRFRGVATPMQYRTISFMFYANLRTTMFGRSTVFLHRTFEENPDLRSYCKYLTVRIQPYDIYQVATPSKDDFKIAEDLMRWLNNVKKIHLLNYMEYLEYHHDGTTYPAKYRDEQVDLAGPVLGVFKNLSLVETARYTIKFPDFHELIWRDVRFTNLKHLEIYYDSSGAGRMMSNFVEVIRKVSHRSAICTNESSLRGFPNSRSTPHEIFRNETARWHKFYLTME